MTTRPSIFAFESWAIRTTIQQLMRDQGTLDARCKYLPGLTYAAVNIRKIEAAFASRPVAIDTNAIQQALAELKAEITNEEN